LWWYDFLEVFGQSGAQFRGPLRPLAKEALTRIPKVLKRFVITIITNPFMKKLPNTLDQIEIRTVDHAIDIHSLTTTVRRNRLLLTRRTATCGTPHSGIITSRER
jgi:hypothetical protein